MKSKVACTALLFLRLVCNRILQVINIHILCVCVYIYIYIYIFFFWAGQVGPNTDPRPEVHLIFWPKPYPIIYLVQSMPFELDQVCRSGLRGLWFYAQP